MITRLLPWLFSVLMLASLWNTAHAQDAEEKSTLVKFVENKLSTPNRQISLNGLQGALSSDIALDSITIADERGVWLKITQPKLVWNRSALLRGKLDIESLTAERIDYLRNADVDENLPKPEALSFELPDLPVTVVIEKLDIPMIAFDQSVFGLAAEASVAGKVRLEEGELDLDMAIERKDGPRGNFNIVAQYAADTQAVKFDLNLDEPANGIIANLLDLENRPPVTLKISGDAPIADLQVDLAFDVAQRRVLGGQMMLKKVDEGYQAVTQLSGPLSTILPPQTRAFFGAESRVNADVLFAQSGDLHIREFVVNSGAATLKATGKRLADGFLSALELDADLVPQDGEKLLLPTGDVETSVRRGKIRLDYDAANSNAWNSQLIVQNFERDGIIIEKIDLTANGMVSGLNDPIRTLAFSLDGMLDGFTAKDPALNEAVGRKVTLSGSGKWQTDSPLKLEQMRVSGDTFQLVAAGDFAERAFDGSVELNASRLAAFSRLAERPLSGGLALSSEGKIWPISGAFDLRINGTGNDLGIGEELADKLLRGEETSLSGGVARDGQGLEFRELRIANQRFQTELTGRYGSDASDLKADARLRDLALLTPRGSGELQVSAMLKGAEKPFDVAITADIENGSLSGRDVRNLQLAFNGRTDLESVDGALSSKGSLDNKAVVLAGDINASAESATIKGMRLELGKAKLFGDLQRKADGLIDADLKIDASNIADLAALALVDAQGTARGTIQLNEQNGQQSGKADLVLQRFRYQKNRIDAAEFDATFTDLFGTPVINGTVVASGLLANDVEVSDLNATVSTSGDTTKFDVAALIPRNNVKISANGSLIQSNGTQTVDLERMTATSNVGDVRLRSPTRVLLKGGEAQFNNANVAVGSGSVVLDGNAGKSLAINATIRSVPLSIINAVRPDMRAGGVLSGTALINGTASNPVVNFDLTGDGVTVVQLAQADVSPLSVSASGTFRDNQLQLQNSRVRNAQNISLTASGSVPLSGSGLALTVDGTFPLSLAASSLANRGATVSGTGRASVFVTNSLADPRANGFIEARGATFTDPLSNLKVSNINLRAGISGDTIALSEARGQLASGGSVSAQGTIGLSPALPANIAVRLNRAKYTDGQTFTTTADGTLRLTGSLAANPLLSGQIELIETEIAVPETFIKNRELLDVRHVRPSAAVRTTLNRIKRSAPVARPSQRPSILQLDLTINAPNRIFVRGRGLDAELGGKVRIKGSSVDVQPIGSFSLRRGRLSILGQRIELDEGTITLAGDLDPLLNLVARTSAGDVTAFIRLQGRASQLEVTFSSSPELPQDEVLALIIFGRGLGDLSPVQIARLASVAAELTGGNSPGLVEQIRRGTGLDNLDIVQDSEGNAAVQAGKYISDRVYLGVQAGKNTEATINLDVTDNVKVRGAVGSEGRSSIGIFLEKDY